MAGLANIQAYNVQPLLQQQAQDAALFAKEQSNFMDMAAKMAQLKYNQNKDNEKRAADIIDGYNKLVLGKNFRSDVTNVLLNDGVGKIKSFLDKGDYNGAAQESARLVGEASGRQEVIDFAIKEADSVSAGLGELGVNKEIFKQEFIKRKLFKQDGAFRSPEEIKGDSTDYVTDVLYDSVAPGLFTNKVKPLSRDYGNTVSEIDVTTDSGITSNRNKLKLGHPSYVKYDPVAKKFDVPNDMLNELWAAEVEVDPVKKAIYSRAARLNGASTKEEEAALARAAFKQDVLKGAATSISSVDKQDYDNTAARFFLGITNRTGSDKYQGVSPIQAIAGALGQHSNYVGSMNFVSSAPGYDKPLIDVTAQMPDKGLVIGRKEGKLITADKVYADPESQAVIIYSKDNPKKPLVYKGAQLRTFLGPLPDFNNIKNGKEQVEENFDGQGRLLIGTDPNGASMVRTQFGVSKSADIENAKAAAEAFLVNPKGGMNTLNTALSGKTIKYKDKATSKSMSGKVKQVVYKDGKYLLYLNGVETPIHFGTDGGDIDEFVKGIKGTLR